MRVLQLIDTLRSGGAERMAINLAGAFSEADIPNILVVSRSAGMQSQRLNGKSKLAVLEKKSFYDLKAFLKLVKTTKLFKPSLIHAHSTSIFWAIALKVFVGNIKVIWHDHYGLSDQLKHGDRKAERLIARWVDGVVVVNSKLEDWAHKELGIDKNRITQLSNFPFLNLLDQISPKISYPIIILQLANFRPQKNHALALKAIHQLVNYHNLEVNLWLVGSNDLDIEYTQQVKGILSDLDLGDYVTILGESENIEEMITKSHLGILSSDSEGLPVSLLEYGLGALPVVVTDAGQCSEVLEGGKFGRIVPRNDIASLVEGILNIINHYEESLKIGRAFKNHIEKNFGAIQFLDNYQKFIAGL